MYTILRLNYKGIITYMMILVDDLCSNYDYLTYDYTRKIFVDEAFNTDSLQNTTYTDDVITMIEKIGKLIDEVTLKTLMYEDITEYDDIKIEAIHIPENIKFKNDKYPTLKKIIEKKNNILPFYPACFLYFLST